MVYFTNALKKQCGAAIFSLLPNSALFRLPALAHEDVQNWMRTTFRTELSILQANVGSPVDLQRIQNESLRLAIEEIRAVNSSLNGKVHELLQLVERRTSVLSPAKAYSHSDYQKSGV
jgi:hypothetical protein